MVNGKITLLSQRHRSRAPLLRQRPTAGIEGKQNKRDSGKEEEGFSGDRPVPSPPSTNEDESISSSSELKVAAASGPSRRRITNSTVTVTTVSSYQPGKAPLLVDSSPSDLNAFLRAAKLYFRTKNIKESEDKVA
ncbi:hypothetical protein JCM11641_001279 [Rhodosporidiobolus odoratus]